MNTQHNDITRTNLGRLAEKLFEVKLLYGQDCSKKLDGQVRLGATLDIDKDIMGKNILPISYYFIPSNGEIKGHVRLRVDHLSALLLMGDKGMIRIDYPYEPFNGGKNGRT